MRVKGVIGFFTLSVLGCAFKFEVVSQRTALENQVLGSYQEIEADAVLSSSVRAVEPTSSENAPTMSARQLEAVQARQSQLFNQDDIDELKDEGLVGETNQGLLAIVPAAIRGGPSPSKERLAFAEEMVAAENRDRATIFQRIIEKSPGLQSSDSGGVKESFAKMQGDKARVGHWTQSVSGQWVKRE